MSAQQTVQLGHINVSLQDRQVCCDVYFSITISPISSLHFSNILTLNDLLRSELYWFPRTTQTSIILSALCLEDSCYAGLLRNDMRMLCEHVKIVELWEELGFRCDASYMLPFDDSHTHEMKIDLVRRDADDSNSDRSPIRDVRSSPINAVDPPAGIQLVTIDQIRVSLAFSASDDTQRPTRTQSRLPRYDSFFNSDTDEDAVMSDDVPTESFSPAAELREIIITALHNLVYPRFKSSAHEVRYDRPRKLVTLQELAPAVWKPGWSESFACHATYIPRLATLLTERDSPTSGSERPGDDDQVHQTKLWRLLYYTLLDSSRNRRSSKQTLTARRRP